MSFFDELTAARNITDEYRYDCNNKVIFAAGVRLQLAILAAMTTNLRSELPKRKAKPKLSDGLTAEECELASQRNGKIPAIKAVRGRHGFTKLPDGTLKNNLGMKEAKELVENWMFKHLGFTSWPYTPPAEPPRVSNSYYEQYDETK